MIYALIGRIVVKAGKLYLRRRYGPTYVPRPLIAATAVGIVVAVAALASRNRSR